ncbi:T9SS type A sorting domain-containing protein [Prolixibacteraceae bacterium JC049]|nr:T9SS type A sorting domain-containing protein [Prolixibacteraceae bacterium JC049]
MNFHFSISTYGNVSVKLFDTSGRCLLEKKQSLTSGIYNWNFELKEYKTGLFYYSFQSMDEAVTGKIVMH